jgi:hypothetical protein
MEHALLTGKNLKERTPQFQNGEPLKFHAGTEALLKNALSVPTASTGA